MHVSIATMNKATIKARLVFFQEFITILCHWMHLIDKTAHTQEL